MTSLDIGFPLQDLGNGYTITVLLYADDDVSPVFRTTIKNGSSSVGIADLPNIEAISNFAFNAIDKHISAAGVEDLDTVLNSVVAELDDYINKYLNTSYTLK